MTEKPPEAGDEGYIVEYVVLGNSVKVTAFDPVTLRDASVIGSKKTRKEDLARLAVRKLEYMIEKTKRD